LGGCKQRSTNFIREQARPCNLQPATCDLRPGWWWGEKHRGAIAGEEELTLLKKTENRKQKQAKYLSALLELGCSEQF
jgi:hypothetical protein